MKQDMIVILDLGSHENTVLARAIRALGVYSEIYPHDITVEELKKLSNVKGIIINGGPCNIVDGVAIDVNPSIYEAGIPVMAAGHDKATCAVKLPQFTDDIEAIKAAVKPFVFETCKAEANWNMTNFVNDQIELVRRQVGDRKVLLALSGGVDSSVVAALLLKAIGDNLVCVHVNHGLMRKGESEDVVEMFGNQLKALYTLIYMGKPEHLFGYGNRHVPGCLKHLLLVLLLFLRRSFPFQPKQTHRSIITVFRTKRTVILHHPVTDHQSMDVILRTRLHLNLTTGNQLVVGSPITAVKADGSPISESHLVLVKLDAVRHQPGVHVILHQLVIIATLAHIHVLSVYRLVTEVVGSLHVLLDELVVRAQGVKQGVKILDQPFHLHFHGQPTIGPHSRESIIIRVQHIDARLRFGDADIRIYH